MEHTTKIGVIVRKDLKNWQKLNVTAFLSSGLAAANTSVIGDTYEDGSGKLYLPLLGQPVHVYAASSEHLQRTLSRAISREVQVALYTNEMFTTGNDADNRAAVKNVPTEELDIVGIALITDRKVFDKITNGLKRHD